MVSRNSLNNSDKSTEIKFKQVDNELVLHDSNGLFCVFNFDELGRKTQVTVEGANNTFTTNYSYDHFDRLDKLTDNINLIFEKICSE